jgi:twitching motility protein PilI
MAHQTLPDWVLPSVALNRPFVLPSAGGTTGAKHQGKAAFEMAMGDPLAEAAQQAAIVAANLSVPATESLAGVVGQVAAANLGQGVEGTVFRQGYRIGNVCLLTGYDTASELTEMLPMFRLPGTAGWVRGVVNLHGNVVPVFDLADLLNVQHVEDPKTGIKPMLLVLGHSDSAAAVIIDGLPERRRFDDADRVEMGVVPPRLQGYVSRAFASGGDIWLDFEHGRFFDDMVPSMA